jgi:DNA-binding NarL/FixJ family response regulator
MTADPDKIKVIIADDHPVVRQGIAQIISQAPDMTVVDQAEDGDELLNKIRKGNLDLDMVLLDLAMPGKNGWEVMHALKVEFQNLPILVLSANSEKESEKEKAEMCLGSGASGYLNKLTSLESLLEAIRQVAKGEKFIIPDLAKKIAFDFRRDTEKQPHKTLSPREFQVFYLIASGKSVNEISHELSLSAATISTYRTRILDKLSLKKNSQLIHYAFKHGVL